MVEGMVNNSPDNAEDDSCGTGSPDGWECGFGPNGNSLGLYDASTGRCNCFHGTNSDGICAASEAS